MKKTKLYIALLGLSALISCYDPDEYLIDPDLSNSDIIDLDITTDSIAADNFSTSDIRVEIPLETSNDKINITFTTTSGVFVENGLKEFTKSAEIDYDTLQHIKKRIAHATLKSSAVAGVVKISARTINGFVDNGQITFYKVLPQQIDLSVSAIYIDTSIQHYITIKGLVKRSNGIPSKGAPVGFKAFIAAGDIGQFFNMSSFSSDSGFANADYTIGNTSFHGQVTIEVSTIDEQNDTIRKQLPITIL